MSDALKALQIGMKPKQEIAELAEGLLDHYSSQPLIDPYDIYQLIMDHWEEVLSDDFYQIAAEGWKAEPYRVIKINKKGQEKDVGWACDLLPKPLLVAYALQMNKPHLVLNRQSLKQLRQRLLKWLRNSQVMMVCLLILIR